MVRKLLEQGVPVDCTDEVSANIPHIVHEVFGEGCGGVQVFQVHTPFFYSRDSKDKGQNKLVLKDVLLNRIA